ncbi:polyribonucleotide nucleotidyltransferase [Buchnera aphidicola]|uniref:polyribonucleotide nucleotidyltransferase n=1 Tax=Buchnera aphidicola TaxID=9 RepID=UPI0031B86E80
MLKPIVHTFQYGKNVVTLETGNIARNANSSIIINISDTVLLITLVGNNYPKKKNNFFPLTVNYQERTYAAGRIPGGFFRREGRPTENEILIARLIDRPLRPLFPKKFFNEIQITATVISLNPQINPDIVAIIGSSAVLSISGFPFLGPIGAARVGFINNNYILNPTIDELKLSNLDLIISSTKKSIIMVEASCNMLSEKNILNAIFFGYKKQKEVINNINILANKVKKEPIIFYPSFINDILYKNVLKLSSKYINNAYKIKNKNNRENLLKKIKFKIYEILFKKKIIENILEIEDIFNIIKKNIIRNRILNGCLRIDGRNNFTVRKLNIKIGLLPRTHGSALFTRGETQALVIVTLGTSRDAQNLDEILGDRTDNFLFHYNFPPYAVGELGVIGSPKRREIGHGKLAKRGILSILPSENNFPYTIRVVSEITESNGSSSMASICGASLALMDAGVPIKDSIAGIAMGLIKEKNKYVIISDILGEEDHLGDMDFKISGSYLGITALQMDIKIPEITKKIIKKVLYQAKKGRFYILDAMNKIISKPKSNISNFAPRMYTIKINPDKIKDIIGKGGSVIRMLTEETDTNIEIEDNGVIKISSSTGDKAKNAINKIKEIISEIKVGKIYSGLVTKIVDFGAFVSIGFGKEGLVHISQIAKKRVEKVTDYLKKGQKILVKVLESDRNGRLRLSMKEVDKFSVL